MGPALSVSGDEAGLGTGMRCAFGDSQLTPVRGRTHHVHRPACGWSQAADSTGGNCVESIQYFATDQ